MTNTFQDAVNAALFPKLPMRLMKEDAETAMYVGLWGLWWANMEKRMTRVVLATVAKASRDVAAPLGPVDLASLPWSVLQLQTFDEECPAWDMVFPVIRADIEKAERESGSDQRPAKGMRLQFDPVTQNSRLHEMVNPGWFSGISLVQVCVDDEASNTSARPISVLNRKRVEYSAVDYDKVHVFIEQTVSKQPLQQKLNGNFGLSRESSLLSAINEWRTWIVLDPPVA